MIYLSYVRNLLQQFDLTNSNSIEQQDWYRNATAHRLVRAVFRNRVVNYIEANLDNPTQININNNQVESFRRAIQLSENEININSYLEIMRQINEWGGQIEILAIGNMLNANINENNIRLFTENNDQDTNTIEIFHVNGNHYNFGLTPQEEDKTNHTIGINNNQENNPVINITNRPDNNLSPTNSKPEANTIKLTVDDHDQHHVILSNNYEEEVNQGNNITNLQEKTKTQLKKRWISFFR